MYTIKTNQHNVMVAYEDNNSDSDKNVEEP